MRRTIQSLIGSGVLPRGDATLDRVPDAPGGIRAVELVDGDDAGWRSDIDLGQPLAADHVDPDEQQPAALELGPERRADFLLRLRELRRFRGPAEREVGADLAGARSAVDRSG